MLICKNNKYTSYKYCSQNKSALPYCDSKTHLSLEKYKLSIAGYFRYHISGNSSGSALSPALPSQFPSDRIAPKGHRLRAYSIGDMLRNLTGFPDHRTCRENGAAWVTPCSVFDLREYL